MSLVWNARDDAQAEAQRQQARQEREREEAQRRAELQGLLPDWRHRLKAIGPVIEQAREAVERAEAEQARRWAVYVRSYHRQSGGAAPRQGTGEIVLLRPLQGQAADVELPARRELEAHDQAEADAVEARRTLAQLEADQRALEHNIGLALQAGAR